MKRINKHKIVEIPTNLKLTFVDKRNGNLLGKYSFDAVMSLIDYGNDSIVHPFTLLAPPHGSKNELLELCHGIAEGFTVKRIEERGRPKRLARDIALYFAMEFFQCGNKSTLSEAKGKVLDLWSSRNWKGVNDESEFLKRVKLAKTALKDMTNHIEYAFDFGGESIFIFVPSGSLECTPFQYLRGCARGWVWHFGQEEAVYGLITVNATLKPIT